MCVVEIILTWSYAKTICTCHQLSPPLTLTPLTPLLSHLGTRQMGVPGVPVFLSAVGLYEVDFRVVVACRDACIYTLTK